MTAKPHSDPHSSPREFTQVEIEQPLHDFIDMEAYDVVAGETYRALVEQLEAERRTSAEYDRDNTILSGRVQGLQEQLETAQERLTAYETPGWINSVQKIMEYRQHLRETWDDYAIAIDDHASEEVRREARASMLRRFSAFEDEGWLSNPASSPLAGDPLDGADDPMWDGEDLSPAYKPNPGEEMGAGGACGEHGVFVGLVCPECKASAPAKERS